VNGTAVAKNKDDFCIPSSLSSFSMQQVSHSKPIETSNMFSKPEWHKEGKADQSVQ
jgi:hypothetical protein